MLVTQRCCLTELRSGLDCKGVPRMLAWPMGLPLSGEVRLVEADALT